MKRAFFWREQTWPEKWVCIAFTVLFFGTFFYSTIRLFVLLFAVLFCFLLWRKNPELERAAFFSLVQVPGLLLVFISVFFMVEDRAQWSIWVYDLRFGLQWIGVVIIGCAGVIFLRKKLETLLFIFPVALVLDYFITAESNHVDRLALGRFGPNMTGFFCCFSIILFFSFYRSLNKKMQISFFVISVLIPFVMLIQTNSRSCVMALLATACLFFLLDVKVISLWKRVVIFILFLGLFYGGTVIKGGDSYTRLKSAITNPLQDITLRTRIHIWRVSWQLFLEHPIAGHGLEGYRKNYKTYFANHKADLVKQEPLAEHRAQHAHNFILGLLSTWGILGLVGFTVFYLAFIRLAVQYKSKWALYWLIFSFFYAFLGFAYAHRAFHITTPLMAGYLLGQSLLVRYLPGEEAGQTEALKGVAGGG